jgi:hypothetical protein
MAETQTLRPNAAGTYSGIYWPADPATVNDSNDATKLATDVLNDWRVNTYGLPNPSRLGVITNVRIYARCQSRPGAEGQKARTAIFSSGRSLAYGSENFLAASTWNNYYTDYAQNPWTSANWSWDDLDALEAGVSLYGRGPSASYAECSEIWVVVTSVIIGGGAQIIGLELL